MSPENAQIFYVEDYISLLETRRECLEESGHHVVDTANSLTEALSKIPDLGKKGVNVAIVDGNLSEMETNGQDGEKVANAIKAQHPHIIVIGSSLENPIRAAHINCPKSQGLKKLMETVTQA